MLSKLRNWWRAGEEDAIIIYRARLLVPLALLSTVVALAYLVILPPNRTAIWFFATFWSIGAIPLFIRRRRAVIFTPDVFVSRPALGSILRVPICGIKRARSVEPSPGEESPIPVVRIELIVGGSLDIQLGVPRSGEIIMRLNESDEASARPQNR